MPFLYRKFFEQVPVNNISEFSATSGVNQIMFLIPAVNGATLSTQDLMFTGNLQVNKTKTTPYAKADFPASSDGVAMDSVLGIHSLIDRVELISARGNTLIEQRNHYQLIAKYQRGVQAETNLEAGRFNNQQLCSSQVRGTRNFLGRAALADDGQSFSAQLNSGLLKNNDQMLNLGEIGGLIVKIYLTEPVNGFFNVDPGDVSGNYVIGNDFNYTLKNVKMFGRYQYATQDLLQQLNGVRYRKTDNLASVIQSSNDTLTNMPQVNALHKMVYLYQPNNDTSNNKDVNNQASNMVVGLKQYLLSLNGTRAPLDYAVTVNPTIQDLPAGTGLDSRVKGNAEASMLSISCLNDQFPPTHSLVNAKNQAEALSNQLNNVNESSLNVEVIGMNYSFNFEDYTVAVPNDLMSINVESAVKTNDPNLPDGTGDSRNIRGQSATQNLFVEYDAQLNYATMQSGR
jgi:hypothetical protein